MTILPTASDSPRNVMAPVDSLSSGGEEGRITCRYRKRDRAAGGNQTHAPRPEDWVAASKVVAAACGRVPSGAVRQQPIQVRAVDGAVDYQARTGPAEARRGRRGPSADDTAPKGGDVGVRYLRIEAVRGDGRRAHRCLPSDSVGDDLLRMGRGRAAARARHHSDCRKAWKLHRVPLGKTSVGVLLYRQDK